MGLPNTACSGRWGVWRLGEHFCPLPPPLTQTVGHIFGREIHDDLCVTEYQAPVRFALFVKSSLFGEELTHEFRLQPKDSGTLVMRTAGSTTVPLLLKLLAPILAAVFVRSEMMKSLQRLKAKLEQMYPEAGTAT
jgi:hypothetical protein